MSNSSFTVKTINKKLNYNQDLRPNSIAFPLPLPPESTINHTTCEESSIRHSIAAMPHHYKDNSEGSLCNYEIGKLAVHSAHYVDKLVEPDLFTYFVYFECSFFLKTSGVQKIQVYTVDLLKLILLDSQHSFVLYICIRLLHRSGSL